ncbi:MAG TPA: hypothetical protein VGS02_17335 [Acidobacteriaceae bacterium]|nr:hypothetical protein [Acidobacteriaceae bacterium]
MIDPIQIAGAEFESLDAMMQAAAENAVRIAADDHGMTLDYSPESIARLETVLAARAPVPEADLEGETRLWGAYFGEVFRRRYPGEWIMAVYPGRDVAMPALNIGGSHVYPLLKVFRRLTMGAGEDVAGFYAKVTTALEAANDKQSDR